MTIRARLAQSANGGRRERRETIEAVTWQKAGPTTCAATIRTVSIQIVALHDGSKDLFVHISAVEQAGLRGLTEGQKIGYDLERGQQGKTSAVDLRAS